MQIDKSGLPSDVVEYIEELETALTDAVDLMDGGIAKDDGTEDVVEDTNVDDVDDNESDDMADPLSKADPAIQAIFSKMASDLDSAREEIRKEREIREIGEHVSKAAQLRNLNGSPAEVGVLLYKMTQTAPAEAEKVFELLKAADAQLESADIFKELGKSTTGTTVSSSVEAKADELRKNDPSLTREMAIAKA